MCTLAIFFNVFEGYPLLVAANRDEHYDRPSLSPSIMAADPKILAGKDLTAGGTWLGVNECGVLVAILNRRQRHNSPVGRAVRSRGLLALDLLRLPSARAAADFFADHHQAYNPFTVLYADAESAGVAFNQGDSILTRPLSPGLHVFSSAAEGDIDSGKAMRAYDRFKTCAGELAPDAGSGKWLSRFKALLSDHTVTHDEPRDAICVHGTESGTVSSSIICFSKSERRFESYFCAGPPCKNDFGAPLSLDVR